MSDIKNKVNIDDKLFLNTYIADTTSHLVIKDQTVCVNCKEKPCTDFCPARVYEFKDNKITVGFEGCLECGACRIACPNNNIDWNYPRGGFGVQFRLA
jgi:ferredoxin like protein